MSEAKQEMLSRIRKALQHVPEDESPGDVEVARSYRQKGERSQDERVELFVERVSEYKATVQQVEETNLADTISQSCVQQNVKKLVVPLGFPKKWIPESVTPLQDGPESIFSHRQLDDSDGVITTCALAVAQTGTIILDTGKEQGRRALTLLPDYHICIVRADQIVELVPEGFAYFESIIKRERPPITFISGPSATSDIELNRVEGVHGPRRLQVIVSI